MSPNVDNLSNCAPQASTSQRDDDSRALPSPNTKRQCILDVTRSRTPFMCPRTEDLTALIAQTKDKETGVFDSAQSTSAVGGESETLNIADEVRCAICYDTMVYAHTTQCSHSFCGMCIFDCLIKLPGAAKCPLCNKNVSPYHLPTAAPLIDMLLESTAVVTGMDASERAARAERKKAWLKYKRDPPYLQLQARAEQAISALSMHLGSQDKGLALGSRSARGAGRPVLRLRLRPPQLVGTSTTDGVAEQPLARDTPLGGITATVYAHLHAAFMAQREGARQAGGNNNAGAAVGAGVPAPGADGAPRAGLMQEVATPTTAS